MALAVPAFAQNAPSSPQTTMNPIRNHLGAVNVKIPGIPVQKNDRAISNAGRCRG